MQPYFKLFRINNIIIGVLSVMIANYSIRGDNLLLLLHCIFCIVCSMSFGNILNDILDLESDKLSHPNRPLPLNQISLSHAKFLSSFLFACLLISSFFLPRASCLYLLVIILPLLISYNFYFKSVPLLGNIIVSFLLSSVFIFTEILFHHRLDIMFIPSILVFGLSLIRELLKDIQDYNGDKKYQINTLPVVIGIEKSLKLIVLMIILFCFFLFIPYLIGSYALNYLISVIILVEIPLIMLVSLLLKNPNKLIFKEASFFIKIISVLGLLVILITNN